MVSSVVGLVEQFGEQLGEQLGVQPIGSLIHQEEPATELLQSTGGKPGTRPAVLQVARLIEALSEGAQASM